MPRYRMTMAFRDKWNHFVVRQITQRHFCSVLYYFMPLYAFQLWWEYICTQSGTKRLRAVTRIHIAFCVISQRMIVFAHIKLPICQNIWCLNKEWFCALFNDMHLRLALLSAHFNCLMSFTNLSFSPNITCCMTMTECGGAGALFQCLFIFSIPSVYHLTPTLRYIVWYLSIFYPCVI